MSRILAEWRFDRSQGWPLRVRIFNAAWLLFHQPWMRNTP